MLLQFVLGCEPEVALFTVVVVVSLHVVLVVDHRLEVGLTIGADLVLGHRYCLLMVIGNMVFQLLLARKPTVTVVKVAGENPFVLVVRFDVPLQLRFEEHFSALGTFYLRPGAFARDRLLGWGIRFFRLIFISLEITISFFLFQFLFRLRILTMFRQFELGNIL